jgi:GntR family transcriptional regulator
MGREQSIAEQLRRHILSDVSCGAIAPGERLGTERELATRYGVSRASVRQALAALETSGVVARKPGRGGGTFLSHAKVERDLNRLVGVPAFLARQGFEAGSRVLSMQIAAGDDAVCTALKLRPGSLVVSLRRIRLADGIPISLELANFPAEMFPGMLEMPLGGSIYELLSQEFHTQPAEAAELIEVVSATDDEAALLGIEPGTALLSITRTTVDTSETPFEFSCDLFRADRTRISVHTPGQGIGGSSRLDGSVVELGGRSGVPLANEVA